jgi:hypothetical protein
MFPVKGLGPASGKARDRLMIHAHSFCTYLKKNDSVPLEAVEGIKCVTASVERLSGIDFHFKFPYQLVAIVYRSIGSKGGIFSRVISVPPLCVYKTEYTTETVSDSDASCIP